MSDLDSLMMHADLANKEARIDNATATALPGVWTPWAQVLCYACHGVRGPLTEEVLAKNCDDRTATPETELDWGEAQCRCHECGARIWVRSDVGKLARICDIVNDDDSNGTRAELWQTGGMCCAAALRQGEDRLVMVTALDGPFVLASYPNEDATDEGGYEDLCELPWDNACESVAKAGVELLRGEIPAVCESCGGSDLRYEPSTDSTDCVDCGAFPLCSVCVANIGGAHSGPDAPWRAAGDGETCGAVDCSARDADELPSPGCCPACSSSDASEEEAYRDSDAKTQDLLCNACGCRWTEVWRVAQVVVHEPAQ